MLQEETTYFNPFPGLRAFEEQEDVLFFGREKQVDELLKKLRLARFLVVIGSSGSGKSSLVKSGLIPALYSGLMAGVGSSWRVCTFRPGNDPIGNMAKGLSEDGVLYNFENSAEITPYQAINESILRRSNLGLIEAYRQSGIDSKNKLLILVDQFEELFRFSQYEKDAKEGKRDALAFINLLLKASEQKDLPIYVVFTMRSDFLGDCTEFRGLPEAINEGQYLVPRMTREERKDAITGPIAVSGADVAPRLLNQLLNDVGDNPDQLPILQHALMRTWDIWKKKNNNDRAIDLEDYEEVGTMQHALSQHAEEAYAELDTDRERQICESLFKTLTDKKNDARGIRRPRRLSEICELANANLNEVSAVIEIFRKKGRGFLMPPFGVKLESTSIIDISHESIMRVWDRLIDWVDEENQSAQEYLRLCEAANLYETGRGGLWRDPELQLAWKWKEENNPNAIWANRYNNYFEKAILFLEHSKKQYEIELQHKEMMQKQRLKRARVAAIIISLVAVVGFLLSIYSFQQKNIATKQKLLAVQKSEEALKQQKIAQQQTKIAQQKSIEALEQKQLAEASKDEALAQKSIAEIQRMKAQQSEQKAKLQEAIAKGEKENAERQKLIADDNAKIAKEQSAIAQQQTTKAQTNEQLAVKEKQVSSRLKDLAESRNMAYAALLLLNADKIAESKKMALDAYQLNVKNDGPKQNSNIYTALNVNWVKSSNNKNQSTFHSSPVRCMASKPNGSTVYTGDESGVLYIAKADNGTVTPSSKFDIKEDIRMLATSPDGSKLIVATALGNGFVMDISNVANTVKEISRFKFTGIAKGAAFVDNTHFYVLSNSEIRRYHFEANTLVGDM
ncbi:MAG: High-affnity carbon uptake protein Hat/HatR, partial [Pedobacter sp.]|nr:High-affnity carbon uptake protein Hat/HatR [Chitinophagaceae bacterium]